MARKYNHNLYKFVKKGNGLLRDKCSPNPTESLNVFGIIGKIIGFIINKILLAPIHLIAFLITGVFYNKETDKPYKGSFMYTASFIMLMFVATGAITLLVQLIK